MHDGREQALSILAVVDDMAGPKGVLAAVCVVPVETTLRGDGTDAVPKDRACCKGGVTVALEPLECGTKVTLDAGVCGLLRSVLVALNCEVLPALRADIYPAAAGERPAERPSGQFRSEGLPAQTHRPRDVAQVDADNA